MKIAMSYSAFARLHLIGAIAISLLAMVSLASATNYTVTTASDLAITTVDSGTGGIGGSGGPVTLRSAVIAANQSGAGPHTISVPAALGPYNLTASNPNTPGSTGGGTSTIALPDLEVGSNHSTVTIQGTGGVAVIVQKVAGNDVISTGYLADGLSPAIVTLTLDHLDISGGTFTGIFTGADDGFGNANSTSHTSITNCNIHDNSNADGTSGQGGAIYNVNGSLTIQGCTFSNNKATNSVKGVGGAVFYELVNPTGSGSVGDFSVSNSTFIGNSAGISASGAGGGAIYVAVVSPGTAMSITNCVFGGAGNGNQTTGGADGGAIAVVDTNRALNITGCSFLNNTAASSGHGGAIAVYGGTAATNTTINYCRFVGNTAATASNGNVIYHGAGDADVVNANENWWGTNAGPGANDLVGAPITQTVRLFLNVSAGTTTLHAGATTTVTADFTKDSSGATVSTANLFAMIGVPVGFTAVDGGDSPTSGTIQSNGTATTTFTAGSVVGTASATEQVDNATPSVNITIPNTAPTIGTISPVTIYENATAQTVNFSGVSMGANETGQTLTITATSNNTSVVPNPVVNYTSANSTGSLSVTPAQNATGVATITVTVTDSGGTANGGQNTATTQFQVTVAAVNQPPTIASISNPTILENSGQQTVNLSGIGMGIGDSGQTLTVTATSNNTGLIPNPVVNYTSPAATGTLTYTPVTNVSGSATITVTVQDSGGTANGGQDTTTTQFTITVTPVNQQPTIAGISNPAAILENAGLQSVGLSGISAGTGDSGQTLTVTATSSNTAVIPNPAVTYTSPNSTGTLSYTPVSNASGSAVITVKVQDNGGTANGGLDTVTTQFTVAVTAVNQPPTIAGIPGLNILENAGQQTVNLSGIGIGPGDSGQTLTVSAVSDNTSVIPNPTVNYTSPSTTGALSFTPVAYTSGTANITVTVQDSGGTANGGHDTTTTQFKVTVTAVNQPPTIAAISNPAAILENSGQQTVSLSGISAGTGDIGQTLTVTATSSNTSVIPNPAVTYTSANSTGSLSYTPVPNASGTAVITVKVQDSGGTANGGQDTVTTQFTIAVTAVNQAPTITGIPGVSIFENAGQQTVNLSGIGIGPGDSGQTLTVSATSDNTALIPNPTVNYTSPAATGSLTFTPVANTFGSATITVTVVDSGGTANGGHDTTTSQFTVTVTAVNQPPTIAGISNPAAILENAGQQTVSLSGISAGIGESNQVLTVTATSNNTALIPSPAVTYTSPNQTGTLSYTPVSNASGTAIITVKVQDNGGLANGGQDTTTTQFTVTVTAVNQAPTIATVPGITILENAGQQTVDLSGIGIGPGDSGQTLTVTATSNNTAVIPNPAVTYTSPNPTGALTFTPVTNTSGVATITVTVQDSGGTANGGHDTTTTQFTVTVTAVNQAPTIAAISNPAAILENAAQQTVNLSGIGSGPGDGSQALTVTATSNNTALIPNPTVNYTSPSSTGALTYTPVPYAFGTAVVTVTVQDSGGTANGGHDTTTTQFTVTVTQVNQVPTIAAITDPAAILENAAPQTVGLSGISAGQGDTNQSVTVTATSSNPSLIPNPTVTYSSPNAIGSLSYQPVTNAFGSAVITVKVQDNGGVANNGVDTVTTTFNVNVTRVNQAPVIVAIAPQTVLENGGQQTVGLTGISAGGGDSDQAITITATSDNPTLVPDPTISYTSPNGTATLNYTPIANTYGTANITVEVKDDGGTANGGVDTTTATFSITVTRVNQPPTISQVGAVVIVENAGMQTVNFAGVSAGAGDGDQALTVTATSSNTALIPNPTVTYSSPNTAGTLSFTPAANSFGSSTITVTAHDNGGTANGGTDTTHMQFVVTVSQTVHITVQTSQAGLSYTANQTTYTSTQTLTLPVGSMLDLSTTSPQAGTAGTQYVWSGWSDNGAISHQVTVPAADTTYTASFTTQYLLTTAALPAGQGTVTPVTGYFDANSSVPVVATPNPGYVFVDWTGPVDQASSSSTTVTMSAPQTIAANFAPAVPQQVAAKGGQVPGEPPGTVFVWFAAPTVYGDQFVIHASFGKPGGAMNNALFDGATLKELHRSGSVAPGITNGQFSYFYLPALNANGMAFAALASAPGKGSQAGVWSEALGPLTLLGVEGGPVPEVAGAKFDAFSSVALPATGGAIFVAKMRHGFGGVTAKNDTGLWRETLTGVDLLIRTGQQLSVGGGAPRTVRTFTTISGVPGSQRQRRSFTSDGTVYVRVAFTDGTAGILELPPTKVPAIVDALTADAPQTLQGAAFSSFGVPAAGDSNLAFEAALAVGQGGVTKANSVGIFTGAPGSAAPFVRAGDSAPGVSGGIFSSFSDPGLSENGTLGFLGHLKTGGGITTAKSTGLWSTVTGALKLAAQAGDLAPDAGSAKFSSFPSFIIPDTVVPKGPLYIGRLANGAGVNGVSNLGLWATDESNVGHLIVRTGDHLQVGGKTRTVLLIRVLDFAQYSPGKGAAVGFNGLLAYRLVFTDLSDAIYTVYLP